MTATVVVPLPGPRVDETAVAERAIPFARALAEQADGRVLLVSVLEVPVEMAVGGHGIGSAQLNDEQHHWATECSQYLESLTPRFGTIEVSVDVRYGDAADEVLAVTAQVEDPVVVLASHARTGIGRALLGSVAFRLVQNALCPVMVIRADAPQVDPDATPSLTRLLVTLDGSANTEAVLDRPLTVLNGAGLHVHLLRVVEPPHDLEDMAVRSDIEGRTSEAAEYLRQIANRLTTMGYDVSTSVRVGDVVDEILLAAEEHRSDLVAMTSYGRRGISRVLFGSVTERIVQETNVPVLLTKPAD